MLFKLSRPTAHVFRVASQPMRHFSKNTEGNDHLDPAYIEKSNKDFEDSLSSRQKAFLRADRLALLESKGAEFTNEANWWNKLKTMTDDEIELMPYGFIKKYGTFMLKINEHAQIAHVDENKAFRGRWDEIKRMDKLMTNPEKDEL